ncbi:hypothetical protein SUGI_0701340 [Cryptomeria japonica]|nr:hypothetical protein SUGI_0701340 [Cryptomeria japonica]
MGKLQLRGIRDKKQLLHSNPMKFQADVENITLPDDNLRCEQRFCDKTHMFDEDRHAVEPENNTLPPELTLNTEQQQDGESSKEQDAQPEGPISLDSDAHIQPPIKRTNRRVINRKIKKKSIILDEDFTGIPPQVYQEWLNDCSDIVKDNTRRLKIKKGTSGNGKNETLQNG